MQNAVAAIARAQFSLLLPSEIYTMRMQHYAASALIEHGSAVCAHRESVFPNSMQLQQIIYMLCRRARMVPYLCMHTVLWRRSERKKRGINECRPGKCKNCAMRLYIWSYFFFTSQRRSISI